MVYKTEEPFLFSCSNQLGGNLIDPSVEVAKGDLCYGAFNILGGSHFESLQGRCLAYGILGVEDEWEVIHDDEAAILPSLILGHGLYICQTQLRPAW